MKFLIVFLILVIFNQVFLKCYCHVARMHDNVIDKSTLGAFKRLLLKIYNKTYHYCYGWMRYCSLAVGYIPSNHVRNFLYKHIYLMDIDKKTCISGGCEFRSPWNIHLGNCIIQAHCILDGRSSIYIGDNVVLGTGVHIWTQEHDVNDSMFRVLEKNARAVVIKDRAWICSDSSLLPGVIIGEGVVIASRAVVTKDCENYCIFGGVPARKLGNRNTNLVYELNGKPHWHFY